MEPIQIVLIVLALVGAWAVVELALTLRCARTTVDSLDKTVEEINDTITEARPVIAKLDGALDELTPALGQVEPLLKQAGVAVEALSADLIEVNGVLRDVSQITGTVSTASGAVSGIADAATEKVQQFIGRKRSHAAAPERALANQAEDAEPAPSKLEATSDVEAVSHGEGARQYYTYDAAEEGTDEQ